MKVQIPMPQKMELEGDAETPDNYPFPIVPHTMNIAAQARHTPRGERKRSLKEASELLKKYFQMGIGPRAIVVIKYMSVNDKLSPLQWGLVTDVKAFDSWPIHIRWGDGRVTWTDESDLQVIYPSTPDQTMRDILSSDRSPVFPLVE